MAAPVTHVALAALVFDKFFSGKNRSAFFVGTLFPDIRYLKVIERNQTHPPRPAMKNLVKEDSFSAGRQFHSLLDIVRENFIVENDLYSLFPGAKYSAHALKLFEDGFFYSRINDWQEYIVYLNDILPVETGFGVKNVDLERWHAILRKYFQSQPSEQSITELGRSLDFPAAMLREINSLIAQMKTDKKIISTIESLYQNFPALII